MASTAARNDGAATEATAIGDARASGARARAAARAETKSADPEAEGARFGRGRGSPVARLAHGVEEGSRDFSASGRFDGDEVAEGDAEERGGAGEPGAILFGGGEDGHDGGHGRPHQRGASRPRA